MFLILGLEGDGCTFTLILLEKLICKEIDVKIIKRETVSAASPTGQKGTQGHLLMRVIKHDLITTKSPADYGREADKEETSPF